MTHNIPGELLQRPVRVLVVGCCRNGSAIIAGLPYLHHNLRSVGGTHFSPDLFAQEVVTLHQQDRANWQPRGDLRVSDCQSIALDVNHALSLVYGMLAPFGSITGAVLEPENRNDGRKLLKLLERETGFEPATSSLGKSKSIVNKELRRL